MLDSQLYEHLEGGGIVVVIVVVGFVFAAATPVSTPSKQIPRKAFAIFVQQCVAGIPVDQVPKALLRDDGLVVKQDLEEIILFRHIGPFHQVSLMEFVDHPNESIVDKLLSFCYPCCCCRRRVGNNGAAGCQLAKDVQTVATKDEASPLVVLEQT